MRSNRLHWLYVVSIVMVVVSMLGGSSAGNAASNVVKVEMTYSEGAEPCITVDPPAAKIYWNQKPRKVRWISKTDKSLFWEIEWKGEEASGGKPNFFGKKFTITKDEKEKDSDRPQRRGWMAPGAAWPYLIRVYDATDSRTERGALLCELDPVIDWGD